MTPFALQTRFDSTSAAGAMLRRQARAPALVGALLFGLGTSSALALAAESAQETARPAEQTTSGSASATPADAGAAIAELRRLSGLTWEQLARLFGVSRRSLHFWASGKALAPSNEEHLQRLLRVVRAVDRGSASANRAVLLAAGGDGVIPFDLLAAGRYDAALQTLGTGTGRRTQARKPSAEAIAARTPRPPEELVGALQDRVHPASGRLLAAKPIRKPQGK
ncbi:MAG: transcriptional regulator [Deltaproteobacteria bacterium HGW-Deltaproteobacteria-14]|jgi:DNA-binding transcriptional regulator YiaG|nr:MAG: transcriptional regulator [Deltaproteobacteria bacterium HGW-Deltaproteobacteria-14]